MAFLYFTPIHGMIVHSMTWSGKRKMIYAGSIVFIGVLIAIRIVYPIFTKAPTCFDGKKNGEEMGVDCGGSCQKFCTLEVNNLILLWSRSFRSSPTTYSAVAYIENQNLNAEAVGVPYEFKMYDDKNTLIARKEGVTRISRNGRSVVFEPNIVVGNRIPKTTRFQFLASPEFVRVDVNKADRLKISAKEMKFENEQTTTPKLSGYLENKSLITVPDIDVIAVLYDKDNNAVTVGKTYIDVLKGDTRAPIVFTWNEPLLTPVVRIEVIPQFNIFSVDF